MRRQEGITLVALVITIVIIVILSSVTLMATFGENGIIRQAELARDLASNSTIKEAEEMNAMVDEYANIISEGENPGPGPEEDKTPPTVEIVVGEITETSIAITANATDDSGEIAKYVYHINGKEPQESTANTYTFIGLTAGQSYTIKVEAFDKAGNRGENSTKASTEKKPGVGAGEIEKNPTAYYGSEVRGYTCTSQGVSKWRIFYADSTNIYLIADDYISYQYAPNGQNGSKIYNNNGTDYRLGFSNVYNDYPGASWINSNSKGKKWLGQFLSSYLSSTNRNIRAVAYMMDTNVWSVYAGEDAEYAMGGPTLELFCASYKDTHKDKYIECQAPNVTGYQVKWSDGSWTTSISVLPKDDFKSIYIKSDPSKAIAMWLASPSADNIDRPSADNIDRVMNASYYGRVGGGNYNYPNPGLRPLVCLKSGVQLNKVSDGVYEIVKQEST